MHTREAVLFATSRSKLAEGQRSDNRDYNSISTELTMMSVHHGMKSNVTTIDDDTARLVCVELVTFNCINYL